jgi:ABC-2 type transport system permease protein
MINLIRSELYKLRHDPLYQALLMVMIFAPIMLYVMFYFVGSNSGKPPMTGIQSFVVGVQANQILLKISLGILAGFFISKEYASGVMKVVCSTGYSRTRIYLAKLAAFMLGAVILSLLCPLISMAIGSVVNGFGSITEITAAVYIGRTLALTALFAAAFTALVAVLAICSTEAGVTVGAALLFFLFFDQISESLAGLIPAYRTVYHHSVFKLFLQMMEYRIAGDQVLLSVLAACLTAVVFALLGMFAFNKKEIK